MRAAALYCSPRCRSGFACVFTSRFPIDLPPKSSCSLEEQQNSSQTHPEGFAPKISRSLGQRLQPNGKKSQTKSQHWRLPAMPPRQPRSVVPPPRGGMSAPGLRGWGLTMPLPLPFSAPVLVALALIESGMKYEDAIQFIRQ